MSEQARLSEFSADVANALDGDGPLRAVLQGCAEAMVRHLGAAGARIWTLDDSGGFLELDASAGLARRTEGEPTRVPVGESPVGKIVVERQPRRLDDAGVVTFASQPLIAGERFVGVMALHARHPLSESTAEALAGVTDSIARGIQRRKHEERSRRSGSACA